MSKNTSDFVYPKGGGNDIGVYKQPMNNANSSDISYKTDPNNMSAMETPTDAPARRVSMGNPANTQMNKHGEVKIRGTGAATKGLKARGPMA